MQKTAIYSLLVCLALSACGQLPTQKQESMKQENSVVENILTRRSIRAYTAQQVSQSQLDTIMKCAAYAPSALNMQSWQVRVVQNAELLGAINASFVEKAKGKTLQGSAARAQEPGFSVIHGAPTLIVVAADKNNPYSAVDCGLLAENILLSAHSLGLGTCVIGNMASILNDPDSKPFLAQMNMPETHQVLFGIALGYPNEAPTAKERDMSKIEYIK